MATDNVLLDIKVTSMRSLPLDSAMSQPLTVDAVKVVHGEWSTVEDDCTGMIALECSKCKEQWWFEDEPPMKIYNYCPNCGAKMDGGTDNGI